MNKDVFAQYIAGIKVRAAVVPEIFDVTYRLERLIEQMQDGDKPETNPQRMDEMLSACASIRAYAEKVK